MPLCRRCHRTYHDLGLSWFDDELLDRAIEVENMRRQIYGEPPFDKNTLIRPDYWYTKHGIRRVGAPGVIGVLDIPTKIMQLTRPGIEPICGMQWLLDHINLEYPEQSITVFFKGQELVAMPSTSTRRGIIKSAMKMAKSVAAKMTESEA